MLKARAADGLFVLIWLTILGTVIYAMSRGKSMADHDLVALIVGLVIYSLFAFRRGARLFACVATITLVAPLYMLEIYLLMKPPGKANATHVMDLREKGVHAYPAMFPRHFVDLSYRVGGGSPVVVGGREVLPLAGVPETPTVYCRTGEGEMVVYQSDALGFRNATEVPEAGKVDFVLLGDSYVHGYCVSDEYTYAAHVSKLGPTINLGMTGTSPLAQLAIYKEYAEHLAPNHILWFFFEQNDLSDFVKERHYSLLESYLDATHSQQLIDINDDVALSIKRYVDDVLESGNIPHFNPDVVKSRFDMLRDFALLARSRLALFGGKRQKTGMFAQFELPNFSAQDWQDLDYIWQSVVDLQNETGGTLTFVYLPGPPRFAANDPSQFIELERKVIEHWSRLGADYVSLSNVVTNTDDPLSLYSRQHFTEEGYKLTADHIVEHLRGRTELQLGRSAAGGETD